MGQIIMITGGARSGKSRFAEEYCMMTKKKTSYIATAAILDDEMRDRVIKHREQRPKSWETWEVNSNLSIEIDKIASSCEIALLDCATILVSNLMFEEDVDYESLAMDEVNSIENLIKEEFSRVLEFVKISNMDLVIVSNELGNGIVPDNRLSRIYRDIVGRINQLCAREATEVYTIISGIPLKIKG